MHRSDSIDQAMFTAALAQPEDQPRAGFAALRVLADTAGVAKIFTVLAFDLKQRQSVRVFTSDAALYPPEAVDQLVDTLWERTLLGKKQPLVLNDFAALASLLPEAAQLRERGCEAMLNVPVVVAGEVIGALNMLHDSGRYDAAHVEAARALVPGAAALLLWRRGRIAGNLPAV
jgi:hypothetical protein